MQAIRSLHGVAVGALFCLLCAAVGLTGTRLQRAAGGTTVPREAVYVPDARYLRPLVLGYDNVLADLLWFRTISYFGDHYHSDRLYPWLARMCDIVTDLDPRAEHVYAFAGVILPWEANDIDGGIRLLDKGVRNRPDSWLLHYHLGMVHYFFKHDEAAAAAHFGRAAQRPGVHPLVARMAALLTARQQGATTTLELLREMRAQAASPEMRDVLDRSIAEAQVAADLERLAPLVRTYRERHGRLPAAVQELVDAGMLRGVPPDPFGGIYEIDQETGVVRSSTGRVPFELHRSPEARKRDEGKSSDGDPAP